MRTRRETKGRKKTNVLVQRWWRAATPLRRDWIIQGKACQPAEAPRLQAAQGQQVRRSPAFVQIRLITGPDCGTPEACSWPGGQERGVMGKKKKKKIKEYRGSNSCPLHGFLYPQRTSHSLSTAIHLVEHVHKQVRRHVSDCDTAQRHRFQGQTCKIFFLKTFKN